MSLPPGPRGTLAVSVRYLRDPFGTLLHAAQRFGDPFTLPTFLGPVVVTGDPAGIKELITADPDVYTALGADLLGPVLGANNLILLSGDAHRAMRAFYNPRFHGDQMQSYGALMSRIAAEHAAGWPVDRPFDVERTMREISLEVILQVVLGLGEPEKRAAFRAAVLALISAVHPAFMFIPALRRSFLGLGPWARFRRRSAAAAALFEGEVALRRAGQDGRGDMLSLLIVARKEDGSAYTSQELLEQMISLIGAGHETTGSALTWALFHVHRNEAVKARLIDELRGLGPPDREIDPAQVVRLPYLDAVCCEALRLEPVAPLVGRTLREPLTLKGCLLPAGASVGFGIVNLHRRADLYPEPDRFSPERFLARDRGPFDFLPFGGGSRRCLGAAFAMYEMKIVLATVLRAHALRLTDTRPVRASLRNTTASPSRKIAMTRAGSALG
jgi:cytochrome P450 family 110